MQHHSGSMEMNGTKIVEMFDSLACSVQKYVLESGNPNMAGRFVWKV